MYQKYLFLIAIYFLGSYLSENFSNSLMYIYYKSIRTSI